MICIKKIKDGAYVINLVEYPDRGTYWIPLFCKQNQIVYFESFGVEYVSEEIKKFIEEFRGNKSIKSKHFTSTRTQFSNMDLLLHWIQWFYICR